MAQDYLRELRDVQPEGPYLIGGFSGGGVTAFEMAHQLVAQGEEVAGLILLDSIPPTWPDPTRADRLEIQLQRLRRGGARYVRDWVRNRVRWEFEKRERRQNPPAQERTPAEFPQQIEAAFREALAHYQMRVHPGRCCSSGRRSTTSRSRRRARRQLETPAHRPPELLAAVGGRRYRRARRAGRP
jgi:pimeloyl-ACP methyl ester carboxylesterase